MKNPEAHIHVVDAPALGADVRCHELHPGRPPLFIQPAGDKLRSADAFQVWARDHKADLEGLILAHGGVVLRGFPTRETADFALLMDLFPSFEGGYAAGFAPRAQISGKVMEATRLAAQNRLPLHSEMAYLREYPARVSFFCKTKAPTGGETTIGDVRELVSSMPPRLVEQIEALGSMTTRNYGPKQENLDAHVEFMDMRGWNQAFYTDDPKEVERLCAERGLRPHWNDDGSLTVFTELQPFVVHPKTGAKLYRSLLHVHSPSYGPAPGADAQLYKSVRERQKHPSGTFLGNGEPLTPADVKVMTELIDRVTYSWPWENGDIMILDNLQVWHGRNPYQGEPRDVQVALLA